MNIYIVVKYIYLNSKLYNLFIMAYRTEGKLHKIRQTTYGNATGDSFAITVPHQIASKFTGVYFSMSVENNSIIFTSGAKQQ